MRVFSRVVEQRSFTRAAEDTGLPRSTVTDAVKQLEARLGVRLLQRTTRQVSPTLDGEAYYRRCLVILADVEDAESAFAGSTPKGLLRVNVQGRLARHFVLPGLPDFMKRYPGIQLYLGEADRFVDPIREGIDCVLRVGEVQDGDMVARQVGLLREVTCASADYVARFGRPESFEELTGHQMIGFWSSAIGGLMPLEFTIDGGIRHITLPSIVSVNGADMLAAVMRQGLGIMQAPRYQLEAELHAGSLVEILPDNPPTPTPVSLLYPRDRQLSPRVRVFIDWLVHEFAMRRDGKRFIE
ncbi:DNA-binding transcriptional LysR family regulator [Pararhizobium capsulatum DSM 1112]|uniref:DNA-binding transcriptional LysR family regulator n=2 Tax=Pararhizobium capsulatum TaxID=34014 RepID=A0ABU0BWB5_9HYPH|nr:DNA-binding transcriptional LysR family regulator [Pararhizobium capsulatum DSM 1112]